MRSPGEVRLAGFAVVGAIAVIAVAARTVALDVRPALNSDESGIFQATVDSPNLLRLDRAWSEGLRQLHGRGSAFVETKHVERGEVALDNCGGGLGQVAGGERRGCRYDRAGLCCRRLLRLLRQCAR
jgi:hypothetical protein